MVPTTEFSLTAAAAELRRRIDDELGRLVAFERGCPAILGEAIRYSLLAPGKRLRPLLVLWGAEACGGEIEAALPAACAVEMIHAYSLIHDDLPAMDDDDLRRGRPTCHKQFGEGLAILAGDALLTRAFEVIAREVHPPELAARCCAELGRAAGATALVGGQADDLQEAFHAGDLATLEGIHRRKTGAMITVSLRLGGLIAQADDEQLAALTTYGEKIGLAFQIVDDLLDTTGAETTMGKRVHKDQAHGKLTFPSLLGEAESRRRAETLIEAATAALAPFSPPPQPLIALAHYIVHRDQ